MLFDRYWDSPSVFPLASIATSHATPVELRARFDALTQPEPASAEDVLTEPDALGYGPIAEGLDKGRLDLIWGQAEAFADCSGPVFGVASLFRGVRERGVSVSILTNSLASTDEPLVHTGYRR